MVRQLNWLNKILKDSGWKVSHSHARFLVTRAFFDEDDKFLQYFARFKDDKIIVVENEIGKYGELSSIKQVYTMKKSDLELVSGSYF